MQYSNISFKSIKSKSSGFISTINVVFGYENLNQKDCNIDSDSQQKRGIYFGKK